MNMGGRLPLSPKHVMWALWLVDNEINSAKGALGRPMDDGSVSCCTVERQMTLARNYEKGCGRVESGERCNAMLEGLA